VSSSRTTLDTARGRTISGAAGVLSDKQAREVDDLRRQLRRVLNDIRAWPEDDARYRSLLADLRELVRLLDEKLPPVTDTLPPT
jgi:hypothetical protein